MQVIWRLVSGLAKRVLGETKEFDSHIREIAAKTSSLVGLLNSPFLWQTIARCIISGIYKYMPVLHKSGKNMYLEMCQLFLAKFSAERLLNDYVSRAC